MPCSVPRKSCTVVPANSHHSRWRASWRKGYSRDPTTIAAAVQPITYMRRCVRVRCVARLDGAAADQGPITAAACI